MACYNTFRPNGINFAFILSQIVPLTFENEDDYNKIEQGDRSEIDLTTISSRKVLLKNITKNLEIELTHSLSEQDLEELMAGGKLTLIKQKHGLLRI